MSIDHQPTDEWDTFEVAYRAFARNHPALRLSETKWGGVHLRRVFGDTLMKADAARRTRAGLWIAHRERFPSVVFDLLTARGAGRTNSTTTG